MKTKWAFLLAAAVSLAAGAVKYPEATRGDVMDDYFGAKVADPYRWLEDVDSKETKAWVAAQNRLSLPYLAKLPGRDAVKKRLTELWNYERYGVPKRVGNVLFYTRNNGLQNQSALYVQAPDTEGPRLLLDPNALAKDGTVAMTQWKVSPDGRHLAYALAEAGSDWNSFRVRTVESGKDNGDVLTRIKFSSISWTLDSGGFFYSRFPEPPTAADGVFEELANQKLYYHRLGTPQSKDVLIYERPDQPKWYFDSEVSDDGLFVFIKISSGSNNANALYYKYLKDAQRPDLTGKPSALVDRIDSMYEPIGNEASIVYLLTTSGAPRKRIMAVDLRSPAREHWVPIVAQGEDVIEDAWMAGRQFVVQTLHDASHRLRRYSLTGEAKPDLMMPGLGSVYAVSSDARSSELFYSYTDFAQPPQNQRCDLAKGRCEPFQLLTLPFNPGDYVTEQRFFKSKDGTRIPIFITRRKDIAKTPGPRPTLLHGYGGFDISLAPSFARPELAMPALALMEQGGIYVVANLRGGGEYGAAWHEAGTKERKQNVFDDFIGAAEYLIAQKLTTSAQLAIHGRSNGGLLVGAVVNQRPDLFAAAVADVGVMDMLRFHKFTIGWAWTSDYGSSDDAKGFKYLFAYSPYHNIRTGTKYPPVLITTADHDDRVVPGHSFKYAAAMQAAQLGDNPILLRVDVQSGHGSGKPTAKLIEEVADRVAFITKFTAGPAAAP